MNADAPAVVVVLPDDVPGAVAWLPAIARLRAAGRTVHVRGSPWSADLFAHIGMETGAWSACPAPVVCGVGWRIGLAARLRGREGYGDRWPWKHRTELRGHPVDQAWAIAGSALGVSGHSDQATMPTLMLHEAHHREADDAWRALVAGPDSALQALDVSTVLAPLATPQRRKRSTSWPGFPLLARMLRESGRRVVAIHGSGDAQRLAELLPADIPVLRGLGAGACASILSRAWSVVSDDPALTWSGAAAGANILAILAPGERFAPRGARCVVLADNQGSAELHAASGAARTATSAHGRWPTTAAVWNTLRAQR